MDTQNNCTFYIALREYKIYILVKLTVILTIIMHRIMHILHLGAFLFFK